MLKLSQRVGNIEGSDREAWTMFSLNNIVFWDMTPCGLKYRYRRFSRDHPLRPGHLYAIYMMSYHEITTSVLDTCMPFTRCHITRSPPPSRTPVCHLHGVISRDHHLRPGHLYAIYTISYHEIATSVPDTCIPFTRHIPKDWNPCRQCYESHRCCMIFHWSYMIIMKQKTTNAPTESEHS